MLPALQTPLAKMLCHFFLSFLVQKTISIHVNDNNTLTGVIIAMHVSCFEKKGDTGFVKHDKFSLKVIGYTEPILVLVCEMTSIMMEGNHRHAQNPKCLHAHKHTNRHIRQLKHSLDPQKVPNSTGMQMYKIQIH